MEGRKYYASSTVVLFVAAFTDRSFGFKKSCSLTRTNVFYSEMVCKVPFNHEDRALVGSELLRLLSEL